MNTIPFYDYEPGEEQRPDPTHLVLIKCERCHRPCNFMTAEDIQLNKLREQQIIIDAVVGKKSVETLPYDIAIISILHSCMCQIKPTPADLSEGPQPESSLSVCL